MKNRLITVVLVMAVLISACGVKGNSTQLSLNDSHWVLEQINGKPVLEGTLPTLSFRGDKEVGGNASCNGFFGEYSVKNGKLTFSPLASTEMYCAEPAGLMDQEAAYLAALESGATYRIEQGKLFIVNAAGETVLVFSAQDMSLNGAAWNLTAFNDGQNLVSLVNGTEITAEFKDGKVAGSSGCNSYNGAIKQNGLDLSFGELASTLAVCQEKGVMEQESAYLQALAKVTRYIVEGKQLTLFEANGLVMAQFSR